MLLGVKWRGFIALVGCLAAVRPLAALRMSPVEVLFVMWNTLVIGAVASLMLAMTVSVQAEGSWCVNKGGTGSVNCGFYSFQQCMASVSGGASFCTQNGFYRSQNDSRRRTRR